MSGIDALQGATAVIQVVELARKTALFLRRVYKAHQDAVDLCQKTEHLSQMLKNVHNVLKTREDRPTARTLRREDEDVIDNINRSVVLCRGSLERIYNTFKPLVQGDPSLNQKKLIEQFKFVMKQNYITTHKLEINSHLSTLSIDLQCLMLLDQSGEANLAAEERWRAEDAAQRQYHQHEAFLQQLLLLFQYVFPYAQAANRPTAAPYGDYPVHYQHQFAPQGLNLAITDENTQQTLQHLFGGPVNQPNRQPLARRPLEQFHFVPNGLTDTIDGPDNGTEDGTIATLQFTDDEFANLERPVTIDMTAYANETTLLLAIKQGNGDLVRNLVSDTNITFRDAHSWTPLHHAVFSLHQDIVDILLSQDVYSSSAYLDAQTSTGETALIYAVQRIHNENGYRIAIKLLEHGCDINIRDGPDDDPSAGSALYYAVEGGLPTRPRQDLIKRLAATGADVQTVFEQIPDQVRSYPCLFPYIASFNSGNDGRRRGSSTTTATVQSRRDSSASQRSRRDNNNNGGNLIRRFSETLGLSRKSTAT